MVLWLSAAGSCRKLFKNVRCPLPPLLIFLPRPLNQSYSISPTPFLSVYLLSRFSVCQFVMFSIPHFIEMHVLAPEGPLSSVMTQRLLVSVDPNVHAAVQVAGAGWKYKKRRLMNYKNQNRYQKYPEQGSDKG